MFQIALKKLSGQDLSAKVAFKLKGIVKRVNEETAKYEEVRTEVLNRLGERDENGKIIVQENNSIKLSEENLQLFIKEMNQLMAAEVQVGNMAIHELSEKVTLTAHELLALDGIITE